MLTTPYLSIAQQLRTAVPDIKHIDLYYGQYLRAEARQELPFNPPAIFIEMQDSQWVEQGINIQEGDTHIVIHCLVNTTGRDTANLDLLTDPAIVATRLAHLHIDDAVHTALQRYTPDGCCRELTRVGSTYETSPDMLLLTKHTYYTRLRHIIDSPRYVPHTVSHVTTSNNQGL